MGIYSRSRTHTLGLLYLAITYSRQSERSAGNGLWTAT